ncbi:DUF2240 family protein [Candidatus Woesearchaeota archaeon]|nr:DUF2240 family protein [Candidatus Woesearchaeota archaeon]
MIKLPYEQIVEKITSKAGITAEELESKVNSKMEQLSGLISKEGAAHIIANELGIKLFEATSGKLQIKNILAGLRNVETLGKAIQVYELREFNTNGRAGKVASFLMGDETGNIRVVLWGEQAEMVKQITPGTIVKVAGAYVKENNGFNELQLNEKSQLVINPEGIKIEVKDSKVSYRKQISELKETDNNVEILGTIVQVFDPRFFEVCPECSKRVKAENEVFACPDHKVVEPDYSYVLNLVVDDGSDNIRTVFFRENMEKVLKASKEKVLEFKDSPEKFEETKNTLLGNIIKINGRAKKNLFFDRIEFLANNVDVNPDPEEEIKRLDAEVKKAETS